MKTKEIKGITLIALVVTIVVLLILAVTSITMLNGQNGILTKAIQSKTKTEETAEKEAIKLAITASKMENIYLTDSMTENVENALRQQLGKNVNFTITDSEDNSFTIKFNGTNRVYYIEKSGKIIENDDILKISTIDDLKSFRNDVNNGNTFDGKYICLMNDITLDASENWIPISNFKGTFLGNNYDINNVCLNETITDGKEYQFFGLFGANDGTIQNLNVNGNISIISHSNNIIIGLVAGLNSGIIKKCSSSGSISIQGNQQSGYIAVGGVIGQNQDTGMVESCSNNTSILSTAKTIYTGGIVGSNNNNVCKSYNTGSIEVTKNLENGNIWTGGIAGYTGKGIIELCFNIADVAGEGFTGAICGLLGGSGETYVKKCKYNNSNIDGIGKNVYVNEESIEAEKDTILTIEDILKVID